MHTACHATATCPRSSRCVRPGKTCAMALRCVALESHDALNAHGSSRHRHTPGTEQIGLMPLNTVCIASALGLQWHLSIVGSAIC